MAWLVRLAPTGKIFAAQFWQTRKDDLPFRLKLVITAGPRIAGKPVLKCSDCAPASVSRVLCGLECEGVPERAGAADLDRVWRHPPAFASG
jgi:hypothetical protein